MRVFRQAMEERPAVHVDEVRAESRERLEQAMQHLADIVARGPKAKVTAAGKIVHDDDGNVVLDDSEAIRALSVMVKADESYRKLLGADKPQELTRDQAMDRVHAWFAAQESREAEYRRVLGEIEP